MFQKWIWEDERRKERLEMIFENNFSCVRKRIFDGSFLRFPDMSPSIKLYSYQKDAVARILFTPNTLLVHDVGAGKTYVMIAAAMEMRRMGLSEKNMFVVPNNIVGQWKNIFYAMYPSANILCVSRRVLLHQKEKVFLKEYVTRILMGSLLLTVVLSGFRCQRNTIETGLFMNRNLSQK